MATLRIYDYDRGVLAADLRHLIDLLVPRSLQAIWIVSRVKLYSPASNSFANDFDASGQGGDQLERLANDSSPVSGVAWRSWQTTPGRSFGENSRPCFLNRTAFGLRFERLIAPSMK